MSIPEEVKNGFWVQFGDFNEVTALARPKSHTKYAKAEIVSNPSGKCLVAKYRLRNNHTTTRAFSIDDCPNADHSMREHQRYDGLLLNGFEIRTKASSGKPFVRLKIILDEIAKGGIMGLDDRLRNVTPIIDPEEVLRVCAIEL
jgi:hypothetical protein